MPDADLLLERDGETARLHETLAGLGEGTGAAVVVEGPAGIGKTRLLAHAALSGQQHGAAVLRARAGEMEQSFAFGVVRQLFDPLLGRATPAERETAFEGAAELASPIFDPSRLMGEAGPEIYPLLHGLFWLCANLTRERPLVLCVDDAQWSDEPSLQFVEFLARRVADVPVAVMVATRPVKAMASRSLSGLLTDASHAILRPAGLSLDALATLLGERLSTESDPGFTAACLEMTEGNPFLAVELTRLLVSEGVAPRAANAALVRELAPRAIAENVLLRVARLPPGARELAESIAVLGDNAAASDAARLAGVEQASVDELLGGLRGAGVLADPPALAFAHPVLRTAVYESVPVDARRRAHVAAARMLLDRGDPAERVAAHLLHVPGPLGEWAAAPLREASQAALMAGDVATTQRCLRRALEEQLEPAQRTELMVELGHAQSLAMDPEAIATLRGVLGSGADPQLATRAALDLSLMLLFSGQIEAFVAVLSEAEAAVAAQDAALGERLGAGLLVATQMSFGAAQRLADRVAALEDDGGPVRGPAQRTALMAISWRDVVAGKPLAGVRELLQRIVESDPSTIDPTDTLAGPMMSSGPMMLAELFDDVRAMCTEEIAASRRRGSAFNVAAALALRSWAGARSGALLAAETDAREALALLESVGFESFSAAMARATLIDCAIESGADLEGVRAVLDAPAPDPDLGPHGVLILARARGLAARGDTEEAVASLIAAGVGTYAEATPAFIAWRSVAATMLATLGRHEEARELAADEVARARAAQAPGALGAALRVQASLGAGDVTALLEEAIEVLASSEARLERAKALVDLGAQLRRDGGRARSREHLRAGHELALSCGAAVLAANARAELAATGERLATPGLTGAGSLTPSERRVAEMAAEGMRNREIAQSLFVTEKTVETHLSRCYGKLSIRSRSELARSLQS